MMPAANMNDVMAAQSAKIASAAFFAPYGDLHALKEKYVHNVVVRRWTVQVGAVYQLAQQRLRQEPGLTRKQREAMYQRVVVRRSWDGCAVMRVRAWRSGCCGIRRICSNSCGWSD